MEQGDEVQVARISVKMPPFWPNNPNLWFAQLEAQFELAQITLEKTRFAYVVANLEERYAAEVEDLITNPPVVEPYTSIKRELISRLSMSEEKRIRQLMLEEELGDSTPSHFYRRLKTLAGSSIPEHLLKTLWLQRLPSHIQAILQAQSDLTIEKLAQIADKINEVQVTPPSVCATSRHSFNQSDIDAKINELSRKLVEIQETLQHRRRSSPRSRSSSLQRTNPEVCWYHDTFGSKARKCIQPCRFLSSENASSSS